MRDMSPLEWLGFCAALYAVCFVLTASMLRSVNDPKKQPRAYTKRPLVGWTAMLLAPVTLVVVAAWSVWRIVVMVKCDIAQHARLGNREDDGD